MFPRFAFWPDGYMLPQGDLIDESLWASHSDNYEIVAVIAFDEANQPATWLHTCSPPHDTRVLVLIHDNSYPPEPETYWQVLIHNNKFDCWDNPDGDCPYEIDPANVVGWLPLPLVQLKLLK